MSEWETVGRPGQFGGDRDRLRAEYDVQHGVGGWRLVWRVGDLDLPFEAVVLLYEDAYAAWFARHPEVLAELAASASDVYDDAFTNVESGLNYTHQESDRTHLQDVAVRRVMVRNGLAFTGDRLVQVRGDSADPVGASLSPGRVPFHRPEWIPSPPLSGWWAPGSIEDFYQSAKHLQRRR